MQTQTRITSTGAALLVLMAAPIAQAQPEPAEDVDRGSTSPSPNDLAAGPNLVIEPGVAMALTTPQSTRTNDGFAQTLKVMFDLTRYLAIGPTATFTTLPASSAVTAGSGTSWSFGGGAKLMRPHNAAPGRRGLYAMSPWVDADVVYVRTGTLDRPGFAVGAGLAVPIDDMRRFWIGPYTRYFQIVQGDPMGYDNSDAKILTIGVGLEIGLGMQRHRAVAVLPPPEPPPPVAIAPVPESDRDGDTVLDRSDNCPDAAGPVDNGGCPVYAKLVIKPDELELRDKISFKWDSALLDDTSRPVLDEIAKALRDNPGFSVQVNGNASSDGDAAYNQTLSESRATTVVTYLVDHGIAKDRLIAHGQSSSVPDSSNDTRAGRKLNRRVEFLILKKANTP